MTTTHTFIHGMLTGCLLVWIAACAGYATAAPAGPSWYAGDRRLNPDCTELARAQVVAISAAKAAHETALAAGCEPDVRPEGCIAEASLFNHAMALHEALGASIRARCSEA